ncbi:MAG: Rieske (2Fe-2S) domain protein [Acidimicrobiales bacterium]|nr:Rieske (2Fe-2S) domain protein [Acidimicrobiales bacterium]
MSPPRPGPTPADRPLRPRTAERISATAFILAAACAVVLVFVYARGADTQAEGLLYFGIFIGAGVGLIVWANTLLDDGQHQEAREPMRGEAGDTAAVDAEISRGGEIERRTLLRRTLWLAGGAVGASLAVPIRSLGPSPGKDLLHTSWADGVGVATQDGGLVRADDVPVDGLLTVFPEHDIGAADAQAVIVRVDPAMLHLAPGREVWAPQGIIAFSKLCTHAACPVGLYQASTHQLLCPCHQSAFDVLRAAVPVSGPAAWPLPQLPLTIDAAGIVRATGDFSEPVGPGWWKR